MDMQQFGASLAGTITGLIVAIFFVAVGYWLGQDQLESDDESPGGMASGITPPPSLPLDPPDKRAL